MPELTETSIAIRQSQVIEVMILVWQGSTIKDACLAVGIDQNTYRRWAKESTEYINAIRDLLLEQDRIRILNLASARETIENQLILDGKKAELHPEVRLKILKWITDQLEEASRVHQAQPGIETEAQEFLRQGPKITKQKSRLAAIDISEDEDGTVRVDLYREIDAIDLDPKDLRDVLQNPEETPGEE